MITGFVGRLFFIDGVLEYRRPAASAREIAREVRSVSESVKKWGILARHPRRADLIRYVRGEITKAEAKPSADCEPKLVERLAKDRQLFALAEKDGTAAAGRAMNPPMSRGLADMRLRPYRRADYFDDAGGTGERIGEKARTVFTPAVLRKWKAGKLTAIQAAAMLGDDVRHQHAHYWLKRLSSESSDGQ